MYVRQLAWLAATPKGSKQSRMESIAYAAETYKEEPEYDLPEIGEISYLIGILSEIGEAQVVAGKLQPTSWVDVKAWSDLTGVELDYWEVVAIISLSRDYVSQYHKSIDSNCPQPNTEELPIKEAVTNKLKALLTMLRGG